MTKKKPARPEAAAGVKRRPYATPKLVVHGDLRKITLGKGSNLADGTGVPKTRNSSGQPG
jgi:hypothetical protein